MTPNPKTIVLIVVLIAIVGSIGYLESQKPARILPQRGTTQNTIIRKFPSTPGATPRNISLKAKSYSPAQEISTPNGFINTDHPITISELVGKKVILLDFWTYSCINCQRTTPYLNAWWGKYHNKGLVIIGVHTPEFEFEHNYDNVAGAVKKFGIKYPVVLDNDFSTWNAYGNRYWPRKYLIDIDGYVVYDHIGEGGYDTTEREIQKALQERMAVLGINETVAGDMINLTDAPQIEPSKVRSPETYFGSMRNENLGNGLTQSSGEQTLSKPAEIKSNTLYLTGHWNFTDEFAENKGTGTKIIFRYNAKSVYFVASSAKGTTITVLRDGKPLTTIPPAGNDITHNGLSTILVKEDRLYKLIEDSDYGEHTLEIIIDDPGLRAFTFTFG